MHTLDRKFLIVLAVTAMLLSACGAASASNVQGGAGPSGSGKGNASLVEFTGVIESIDGNQWKVNGQVITVDPAVIHDGPFKVGDTVKVEANVQPDGSGIITHVETPSTPSADSTDAPAVPSFTKDASSAPEVNSFPDPNEASGTVDSFDGSTIVIDGQSYVIANGAEIKGTIVAGSFVNVEFVLNSDGTMSIREIKLSDPNAVDGNGSNSNGHDANKVDDHQSGSHDSGDQNDDHGGDSDSHDQNDDHGGSGG